MRDHVRRLLPIVGWLPAYDRRWLRGDVAAGIAVTALVVPKNLGYAGIAGVPLQNGLYAAAAGALIYALFCTSRQISTGPSSSLAAVAGGAVLVTGLAGDDAAQLVAAITLFTGVLFLLLAVFRMGWIAQFLSKAVVTGFLAGAAVDVVIGELPKLTGTSNEGDNAWRELGSWLRTLDDIQGTTLLVGVAALALILGLRFLAPAVPGALVLVVGGLVASWLFDLGARGVALVGDVPRGLPSPDLPSLDFVGENLTVIVIASLALLLIGFSQTAGDARAFATRHRYRIDVNQESVAQGMANVGAGVFQGMPVSTSLSASSLNESAGARTPVASLVTGGLVLATLVVLAPVFSGLPKAVLAAIIIDAVIFGMIDVAELKRLRRVARFDFWIAAAAILGVLSAGVLAGVVIGVVLSLGWLIYVATRPPMALLGREVGTQVFREARRAPRGRDVRGDRCPAGRRRAVLRNGGSRRGSRSVSRRRRPVASRAGARSRRCGLRRLAGLGEAGRDPRAHRCAPHHASPGAGEAPCVADDREGRNRRPDRSRPRPRQRPPRCPGRARRPPNRRAESRSGRMSAMARMEVPNDRIAAQATRLAAAPHVARTELALAFEQSSASSPQLHVEGRNFYPLLLADIAAATTSVHVNQFGFRPGLVGDRFAEVLVAKAGEGVPVRLIVDRQGSDPERGSRELYDRMTAAGIQVCVTRATQPRARRRPLGAAGAPAWNLEGLGHIDHRKLVVVDGRTGWVGGAGIEDHFENGEFHDLFVRVEGPVVSQLPARVRRQHPLARR